MIDRITVNRLMDITTLLLLLLKKKILYLLLILNSGQMYLWLFKIDCDGCTHKRVYHMFQFMLIMVNLLEVKILTLI